MPAAAKHTHRSLNGVPASPMIPRGLLLVAVALLARPPAMGYPAS